MKKTGICITLTIVLMGIGCKQDDKKAMLSEKKQFLTEKDTFLLPPNILKGNSLKMGAHPMANQINTFLSNQVLTTDFKPSANKKEDYLKVIEKQVRAMLKYQDSNGHIIDPVEKTEKYYTTPCFAHSVSALVASSYIQKNDLLAERGMKALDIALVDMVNATVNGNHGDFYTWPVMMAYSLFKPYASKERLAEWDRKINSIKIEKLYATYDKSEGNNWVLVHTSGEFLRNINGFTNTDYVEKMLGIQLNNFTELGMYNEHGNPLPYDLFPRHYLSGMLQLGYKGKHAVKMRDNLWKGAWTSLFMQSPFGELPTGYRSSHHIWNEAEQCVLFEIYASAYAKSGRVSEAGAFKRAASLSLESIKKWIRMDGSGFIVKNRFPIEKRHGYEKYSMHTCYNMLATSMLAQAWQFSNDEIEELPSPADIGGFVLPILKPFHKIIANASGTYLEYETEGDNMYNPTGIVRVHLKDGNPQLGPSNGLAPYFSGEGTYMATGPSWRTKDGSWESLAKQQAITPEVEIIKERQDLVKFKVTYNLGDQKKSIETITIEKGKVTVNNEFKGIEAEKRITWPMLVFDGENNTKIELNQSEVSIGLKEKAIKFSVLNNVNGQLKRTGTPIEYVNGIAEGVYFDFTADKIRYSLESTAVFD
ncbi:hypothetical protein [Zobellia galactanivorans]|uniref:hypothetical protein n=1 Tax=Zobellia galactanivorans (strain DSM 12802 / CCUG 47099 / CIP 106680 / NCIMB 13871 / Dsij) TaxID=63186 RepID=UPI001C076F31|nr:hypothetical protein [Zobellia galactanivorans]MBU3028405.1 hypothetical protein [Zobellia galactanivorans]